MEEPREDVVDAPEQDVTEMDDAALDALANGRDEEPAAEEPEAEPAAEEEAPEEAAPEKGEPGDTAPGIEELRKQNEAIIAERDNLQKRLNDRQATVDKQGMELGELRKLKAKLVERVQQRKTVDPHQQMIEDPAAFQRAPYEQAQDEQKIREIEEYEAQVEQQQAIQRQIETHSNFLSQHAPDLTEHIDDVAQFFLDNGATPEAVATFKQNPATEHPGMVWATHELVKANKAIADLTAQLEQAKAKPEAMLKRIEGEARKGLTNTAGAGGKAGSDPGSLKDEDWGKLSDEELDAFLKEQGAL